MDNKTKKTIKKNIQAMVQHSRYTESELSLISNVFFENDALLFAIRKFFLQGELNQREQLFLNNLTDDVIKLLRKCLLPEIDPNAPLHLMTDLWVSIDTVGKLPEDSCLDMKARKIVIDYLEDQFERMPNKKPKIWLKDLVFNERKNNETAFIELKARNTLISHIDGHFGDLRTRAITNAKIDEAEKIRRLGLDSNK